MDNYEKNRTGEALRPPGYRPAIWAILLYVGLVVAVRNAAGRFPPIGAIADLDQRLYFAYLDTIAFAQYSLAAHWATAFLSTVATECCILGLMLRRRSFPQVAKAGCAANLATHPVFWYLLTGIENNFALWVVIFEFVIAGVEALVLFAMLPGLRRRDAVWLAVAANGASFLLGLAKSVC